MLRARRRAAAAAGDRARAQARLLHAGRGVAARAAGGARARPAVAGAGRAARAGSRPRRSPRCSTATSPPRGSRPPAVGADRVRALARRLGLGPAAAARGARDDPAGGRMMPSGPRSSFSCGMRRAGLAAVLIALLASWAAPAFAQDPEAPDGAPKHWLANEDVDQLPLAALRGSAAVRADRQVARRRLPLGARRAHDRAARAAAAAGSRASSPRRSSRRAAGEVSPASCASSPTARSARSRRATSASTSSSTRCTRTPSRSGRRRSSARATARSSSSCAAPS